jgi:hypothetical protein
MADEALLAQAKELGIEVDGRWSDKRLKEEIEKKQAEGSGQQQPRDQQPPPVQITAAAPKAPVPGMTPIRLLYDAWLKEDERTPAGTVLDVPVALAKKLLGEKKAERADPLPGDE